jgi:hypothetical protein
MGHGNRGWHSAESRPQPRPQCKSPAGTQERTRAVVKDHSALVARQSGPYEVQCFPSRKVESANLGHLLENFRECRFQSVFFDFLVPSTEGGCSANRRGWQLARFQRSALKITVEPIRSTGRENLIARSWVDDCSELTARNSLYRRRMRPYRYCLRSLWLPNH